MATLAPLAYLVASVCFIMALRGLSHPETARKGLNFGIAGMALAAVVAMLEETSPSTKSNPACRFAIGI